MNGIIEANIAAIVCAIASVVISFFVTKTKVEILGERLDAIDKITTDNTLKIERRNEEMRDVHRRLNAIDALAIEANMAEVKTELKHIRALLEKR